MAYIVRSHDKHDSFEKYEVDLKKTKMWKVSEHQDYAQIIIVPAAYVPYII